MLYNYIKINADKIVKATPSGYYVNELKKPSGYWTKYETSQFTDNVNDIVDFRIINNPRSYVNLFDAFIQNKGVTAINLDVDVNYALNIESKWDKNFPESIRLKYPGSITNNNFSSYQQLDNEENYTFKVWENRSSLALSTAKIMPNSSIPTITKQNYFYDLLSFVKLDNSASYEDWLKRPLLSLKTLLSKSIAKDDKFYQLYKVNDVNVQSLSENFDEYIPWCFDQNGTKIDQYKIATITSFNKKEMYILLELREDDIQLISSYEVEIPIINSIVFWRSGLLDESITMDIRNKDQMLLSKNDKVSNISDYFRESNIDTNTLVNFQKDRLEDTLDDTTPVDNDDVSVNEYNLESNTDTYFNNVKGSDIFKRFMFGKIYTDTLNISMGTKLFTDHMKNKVHIFIDGYLLTNDSFYILNGNIYSSLPNQINYIEIYIDQYDSVSYSFNLDANASSFTQDELSYILYNNGFLWKTTQDKEYLIFEKYNVDDVYRCNLVNDLLVPDGNFLIIHSLFFDLDSDITVPVEVTSSVVSTTDEVTDISDYKDYNINYDPILFRTSVNSGSTIIEDKDMWIFDNSDNLIKIEDNEPYLMNTGTIIEVMGEDDKNIALDIDSELVNLRSALTVDINNQGTIHDELINTVEKEYLIKHYGQMSTVNRNILNMFLNSGIQSSWATLVAGTPITLNKDYMIIRYTGTGNFPILKIRKPNVYKYNTELNEVDVKVKPVKVTYNYYILHRADDAFANLYSYSFDKAVSYVII